MPDDVCASSVHHLCIIEILRHVTLEGISWNVLLNPFDKTVDAIQALRGPCAN